ncbi:MAG TPA: phosphoglucosamine mutase [Bacillota bacterium]|nr:phosphoglucosamine mutase [Bacillota bacterium]HOB86977.1 phosphoglucosamine mutase [Bacillota bacterium]HOP69086.1 phosphoglucosamine mutase [Bacillota bacterium]HPT34307.1 phosphoglucosamine mutase [Bacillota bacterium]HPZ64279.1 phosphoglucosamine mutase [Bacillota bacterium]
MKKLFGTDGVRGVANLELSPEMAFRIGRICAYLLKKEGKDSFIVIGKDTRKSGDMLQGALVAGICSSGMEARTLGILSTPALAFLTRKLEAAAGIMISASHNPIEDNGLKIFAPTGYKISDELEAELEKLYFEEDRLPRPQGGAIGQVREENGAVELYTDYLKDLAPDLSGMHIAMDCGHGAVYKLAPEVFRALGAKITVLNDSPNGVNINVQCGSTNPSALQEVVKKTGAQLGLAFDGDADRLIAVDEKGEVVDGDLLMLIFALYLQKKKMLTDNTFVTTVMSNGGLDVAAQENGLNVIRTSVGDRYVLEKMLEGGYRLGGEQSGHLIFSDFSTTGDGLLSAIKLAEVLQEEGRPLSSYRSLMTRLPQVTVNCRVSRKDGWEENPAFQEALQNVRKQIGPYGRVLVRPSGTEPLMRVMVEGPAEESALHSLASELASILAQILN